MEATKSMWKLLLDKHSNYVHILNVRELVVLDASNVYKNLFYGHVIAVFFELV